VQTVENGLVLVNADPYLYPLVMACVHPGVGVPGHLPPQPLTAADLVRRAADDGLGCVQIADNLPLDALADGERRDLRTLAAETAVAIEVGACGLTPDRLERHLDLAVFFHSPILRFVIDGPGHEPTIDDVVGLVGAALPRLRETGVRLAIENHDRLKAAAFREVVLRTDPEWVGICLDSVNSMGAGEGVREVVAALHGDGLPGRPGDAERALAPRRDPQAVSGRGRRIHLVSGMLGKLREREDGPGRLIRPAPRAHGRPPQAVRRTRGRRPGTRPSPRGRSCCAGRVRRRGHPGEPAAPRSAPSHAFALASLGLAGLDPRPPPC
jgi:hypothetical protein